MTILIDGKSLSTKILDDLAVNVSKLNWKPHLAVILVGEDPASQLYVGMKEKMAKKIGMESSVYTYSADAEEYVVLDKINELNNDKSVDAILVQLPLPKHISETNVIQSIKPEKDADGITPENIGRISIKVEPFAYPCTPLGVLKLLDEYKINIEGKHAVIVGRSNIVGKPLAQMLLNRDATVTVCHSKTNNLAEIIKTADVLISAVGKYKIIRSDMIKSGCIVIDVGTSKIDGKTRGDVDFDSVSQVASYITPVPGGVGPMTIACLMENTYRLSKLNRDA